MIKLPKEVGKIVNTLESKGYNTYCTGDCVRLSLMGESPVDWDILTTASFEEICALFPEAENYSDVENTLRFDYVKLALESAEAEEEKGDTEATKETESKEAKELLEEELAEALIIDLKAVDSVEEYLGKAFFTVNAIAASTTHGIIDTYGGKADFSKKLIKTVKEPKQLFAEKPYLMLEALALVSEMDFDLSKDVYEAILANENKLGSISVGRIRESFCDIMGGSAAGKALKMLVSCNMLPCILGSGVDSLSKREIRDLEELAENAGKTKNVFARRIALFYLCLGKKKAVSAIEYMNYDEELKEHFLDTIRHIEDIYFLTDSLKLKHFLSRLGLERYEFVHNVAKAQVIVCDTPKLRVEGRNFMFREFKRVGDPIFVEDLKLTGEELIEAGICADEEDAKNMLFMLCDVIHREPSMNTNKKLLDKAKWFKKHKIRAAFRNVNWKA